MAVELPSFALLLFVFFHGVAFGAGLYEQRVVVPRWMGSSPNGTRYLHSQAMRIDDSGRRFWGIVSTGPLTLLTLINLYFAVASTAPARTLWLAACAVTLVERTFTFAFFIPKAMGSCAEMPRQRVQHCTRQQDGARSTDFGYCFRLQVGSWPFSHTALGDARTFPSRGPAQGGPL
jgi:hypothetical protein